MSRSRRRMLGGSRRLAAALAAFVLTALASTALAASPPESRAEPPPPLSAFLALDFILPGYGAFYEAKYATGAGIALLRIGTAGLAVQFQRERSVYRAAARAARLADFYYAAPLRYRDPYGDGFRSADEFVRLSDRRAAYVRTSVSAHLLITALSLARTYFLQDRLSERFRLDLDVHAADARPEAPADPRIEVRMTLFQ